MGRGAINIVRIEKEFYFYSNKSKIPVTTKLLFAYC